MKATHKIAFVLVIIGALNWLLIGLNLNWNVVDDIFGVGSIVSRIIYILVGLSALVLIFTHKKSCKDCMKGDMKSSTPSSSAM